MFGAVSSKLIVSVDDRFRVAVGVERVAEFFEFLAEFEIVVDLAVEDDPRAAILIVDGLLAALQIDDGEASHRESDGTVDVKTVLVGTTMPDRLAHPRQQLLVNRFSVVSNNAYNSTHKNVYQRQHRPGINSRRSQSPLCVAP